MTTLAELSVTRMHWKDYREVMNERTSYLELFISRNVVMASLLDSLSTFDGSMHHVAIIQCPRDQEYIRVTHMSRDSTMVIVNTCTCITT